MKSIFQFPVRKTILFFLVVGLIAPQVLAQNSWSVRYKGFGTFSSPRVADLNGDGVGDIIFGAGREEFKRVDSAVIALDGRNGKMLWKVKAIDHIYGSAALKDLNGDHVQDVVIGGRSAELFAINGKTGEVLWRFDKKARKEKWLNFYNAQFVKDQDHDGLDDILISNGGNVMAAPYDTTLRYAGNLLVLSSKDGRLLAKAKMPDNKETYMSVSAVPTADGRDYKVIFGTGGETIGGSLYVTTLSAIMAEDLSKAKVLASSPSRGYIAPAVWIDINGDDVPDIIANAVEGKLLAFDGNSYAPLWSVKVPNVEAYSSIAPGFFTDDQIPDFLASYAVGQWPNLEWSKQIMVNGANGKIEYVDSLGFYQTSTPVVLDTDGDGRDEALLSVNIHVYDDYNRRTLNNILVTFNFKNNELTQLADPNKGSNISTTPWIGDLDHDGLLDVIYFHATNVKKTYTFDGMQVNRLATKIPVPAKIPWGSYMGSDYNGIYRKK